MMRALTKYEKIGVGCLTLVVIDVWLSILFITVAVFRHLGWIK